MNQAGFFHPGDNLNAPSRCGVHPLEKALRVACAPKSAGRHHANGIRDNLLCGAMKTAKDLHWLRHRIRIEETSPEDALSEARHLPIFVQRTQTPALQTRNLEPNRIGADIDSGEGGHRRLTVYMRRRCVCIEVLAGLEMIRGKTMRRRRFAPQEQETSGSACGGKRQRAFRA